MDIGLNSLIRGVQSLFLGRQLRLVGRAIPVGKKIKAENNTERSLHVVLKGGSFADEESGRGAWLLDTMSHNKETDNEYLCWESVARYNR